MCLDKTTVSENLLSLEGSSLTWTVTAASSSLLSCLPFLITRIYDNLTPARIISLTYSSGTYLP